MELWQIRYLSKSFIYSTSFKYIKIVMFINKGKFLVKYSFLFVSFQGRSVKRNFCIIRWKYFCKQLSETWWSCSSKVQIRIVLWWSCHFTEYISRIQKYPYKTSEYFWKKNIKNHLHLEVYLKKKKNIYFRHGVTKIF